MKNEPSKRTITGIPSGDLECWCLLVDRETFKWVKGVEPEEIAGQAHDYRGDVGRFAVEGSPYRYMLYPSDLIPDDDCGNPEDTKPVTFTIEVHAQGSVNNPSAEARK